MLNDTLMELSRKQQDGPLNIHVPDEFYQTLLEELLERSYLSDASDMQFVNPYANGADYRRRLRPRIHWLQMTRLPVHPNENQSYDLLSRWQGVLTSLHAWDYRLYFLLLRHEGKTKLFIGTGTTIQDISAEQAVEQLSEAAFGSMPGIGLRVLEDRLEAAAEINEPLQQMNHIGAVTASPPSASRNRGTCGLDRETCCRLWISWLSGSGISTALRRIMPCW